MGWAGGGMDMVHGTGMRLGLVMVAQMVVDGGMVDLPKVPWPGAWLASN